jgi:hypothetical protein
VIALAGIAKTNGATAAANVSAAIPARVFKEMIAMIFLRFWVSEGGIFWTTERLRAVLAQAALMSELDAPSPSLVIRADERRRLKVIRQRVNPTPNGSLAVGERRRGL